MANVIPNPAAGQFSGAIGDLVFVHYKNGKAGVRRRGARTAEKKPAEIVTQGAFSLAVLYAKAVWAQDPALKARYTAVAHQRGRQGFQLAKADFLVPPAVDDIQLDTYSGNPGELIRIAASDNFGVKGVEVVIEDLTGQVIEKGPAGQENGAWVYRAQTQVLAGQTVVIHATATDHPGHTGSKRVDHACGPRSS